MRGMYIGIGGCRSHGFIRLLRRRRSWLVVNYGEECTRWRLDAVSIVRTDASEERTRNKKRHFLVPLTSTDSISVLADTLSFPLPRIVVEKKHPFTKTYAQSPHPPSPIPLPQSSIPTPLPQPCTNAPSLPHPHPPSPSLSPTSIPNTPN